MNDLSVKAVNELFMEKLNDNQGINKVAQDGTTFIRQKLRESSFARRVVPPMYVTKDDLQRSINHDGLVKITDIEPDSDAMIINVRGNPTLNYVRGERFEIPFHHVSSEDFQKTETELLAYEMPLTEVIEKNSILDIQRVEDEFFMSLCDSAIAHEATKSHTTAISDSYETNGSIPKKAFASLFNILDGNQLKSEVILMDQKMFNRLFIWDATTVGDAVSSETTVNGYSYAQLFNRRLIVSNKTSLLENKIYAFTDPAFFAQFLILSDAEFWLEKKKNIITWAAWETIGMGIGNTKSVARLTLS